MIRSLAISLALLAFVQSADPVADLIKSLPTWGPTPTKQYSGYLDIKNTTKHLHYWFVEAEGDPSSAPLVLWFNGEYRYIDNIRTMAVSIIFSIFSVPHRLYASDADVHIQK